MASGARWVSYSLVFGLLTVVVETLEYCEQNYWCEEGHCCGDGRCCTYYYELWWFWVIWVVIAVAGFCCFYHKRLRRRHRHTRRRQRERQSRPPQGHQQRSAQLYQPIFQQDKLLRLPSYEESVESPPEEPPAYSALQYTTLDQSRLTSPQPEETPGEHSGNQGGLMPRSYIVENSLSAEVDDSVTASLLDNVEDPPTEATSRGTWRAQQPGQALPVLSSGPLPVPDQSVALGELPTRTPQDCSDVPQDTSLHFNNNDASGRLCVPPDTGLEQLTLDDAGSPTPDTNIDLYRQSSSAVPLSHVG